MLSILTFRDIEGSVEKWGKKACHCHFKFIFHHGNKKEKSKKKIKGLYSLPLRIEPKQRWTVRETERERLCWVWHHGELRIKINGIKKNQTWSMQFYGVEGSRLHRTSSLFSLVKSIKRERLKQWKLLFSIFFLYCRHWLRLWTLTLQLTLCLEWGLGTSLSFQVYVLESSSVHFFIILLDSLPLVGTHQYYTLLNPLVCLYILLS